METVSRKVVYRMYPSPAQQAALLDTLGLHQRLYNAALEQRITAWRIAGKSLGYVAQCADLTDLRADDQTYAGLNAQSSQVTLKRLDLAYQAFFRRVKSGEEPGFRATSRSTVSVAGDTSIMATGSASLQATATGTAHCAYPESALYRCAGVLAPRARSRPARFSTRLDAGTLPSR